MSSTNFHELTNMEQFIKMVSIKCISNWKIVGIYIVICAVVLFPLMGIAAENKEKAPPKPITTNNPDISINELEYHLKPLTKDDLSIEADGWLQVMNYPAAELRGIKMNFYLA